MVPTPTILSGRAVRRPERVKIKFVVMRTWVRVYDGIIIPLCYDRLPKRKINGWAGYNE